MVLTRRTALLSALATATTAGRSLALTAQEITWDDLIPPGVPYSEIIGEGDIDYINDTWRPVYDANAVKVNDALDRAYVRMPGYIVPLDIGTEGINRFILVPYVGACVHVPPPPANQLVFVTSEKPWPADSLWDAVWVTGEMRTMIQSMELAEVGYYLRADEMELYSF